MLAGMGNLHRSREGRYMNELSLFTGAGGGLLGSVLLDIAPICAVEIGEYQRKLLLQRQQDSVLPKFPIWDDIKTFPTCGWARSVDIITGGFPCQHFSTATRGRATAENLWPYMARIIKDIRPSIVLCENVSEGAIIKAGLDLWCQGYSFRYAKITAADLGADHVRERYWLLAYTDNKSELFCKIYAKVEMLRGVCQSIWKTFPGESRMVDGVANRVDRFTAIGNGQIPAMVVKAWEILISGQSKEIQGKL
jgi:DNA (cytosine-5)-methyltransferase 1